MTLIGELLRFGPDNWVAVKLYNFVDISQKPLSQDSFLLECRIIRGRVYFETNPYLGKMEECQCMVVVGGLGFASGAVLFL